LIALDFRSAAWPPAPLDAAGYFYRELASRVRAAFADGAEEAVAVIYPPAGHAHRAWRLAAIQELAREAAPKRVNAIAGSDDDAIRQTLAWLEKAPGVTGQLLAVDAIAGEAR